MEVIKQKLASIKGKFDELSKTKKIVIGIISFSVIASLIYLIIYLNTTTYNVLFSNMDSKDSGAIIEKLKEKKVEYKIENQDILVPSKLVDSLRMELLSEVNITGGSSGWELFSQDKMVSTEFEDNIKYINALSGEIERAIKSFEEIKDAKVMLVVPEKSVFVREKEPSSASVVILLQDGIKELKKSQVKTIVALLTGSVENLPVENVHIAVNGMELVTEGLYNKDDENIISNDEKEKMRKEREAEYEKKILEVLKGPFGSGVKVAVNLNMNFDAKKSEKVSYEEGVVVSEKKSQSSTGTGGTTSSSPVDNNMNNTIDNNRNNQGVISSESTTNYNVPETKEVVIEAPGKIDKMTISVIVDSSSGTIDSQTEDTIRSLAENAVGFNEGRGDTISVASMKFIEGNGGSADQTYEDMIANSTKEKQLELAKNLTYAIVAIIILFALLIIIRKVGREEDEELEEFDEEYDETLGVINDIKSKPIEFAPIDFDVETEQSHITNEVKKYAKDKPEQVAEIIKSWLSEDERW